VRERLAVSCTEDRYVEIQSQQVEGDVTEQNQITIRNKSAAVENSEDSGDINRAWDNITENTNISAQECLGYCELKRHKPWFDKECSRLIDQRKQAKLQWLQAPSKGTEDNLSNA
jgi:hypothetical protein